MLTQIHLRSQNPLQNAVQDATTAGQAESQAGLSAANQAELAQLARITQKLAPQLGSYTNLLDYAKVVSQLLVARTSASSEMLERSYSVEGIELRLPVVGQGQVKIAQPKVEGQSGDRLVKSSNTPKTILLLAANPKGTTSLRLDEEVREIYAGLQRAKHREQFVLEQKWAVRPQDIRQALLDIKPPIFHFSGHGTRNEGLVFEDETGIAKPVDGEALGTTPLRLDEEVREIDAGLQRAKHREQFVLEQKWAVRPQDIRQAILDSKPSIVHFSGHGTGDEGLVFEDETGAQS